MADVKNDVDTLFTNFEELSTFRNNFTAHLKKLGEDEPTWLYMWVAHTKDHHYIPFIDKAGNKTRFNIVLDEAKKNNLDALYFVPREKNLPTHKVVIPDGSKPVAAYRTGVSKLPNGSLIRYVQYYILGFEKDGKQWLNIIKPSGETRTTNNFKLKWVSEKDNMGVPAILHPSK